LIFIHFHFCRRVNDFQPISKALALHNFYAQTNRYDLNNRKKQFHEVVFLCAENYLLKKVTLFLLNVELMTIGLKVIIKVNWEYFLLIMLNYSRMKIRMEKPLLNMIFSLNSRTN